MVSVTAPKSDELEDWLERLAARRGEAEMALIRKAALFAREAHEGHKRASGEPYFQHLLAAADIVAGLRMDHETIAATFLHDTVEDTSVTLDDIQREFGDSVASLVDGVTRMEAINHRPGEHVEAESLRKMLLAMAQDIRVVLIKLADRLHNMRTLSALRREKQVAIAKETMELFAPLANRLGIWQVKWELEDLSFRYMEPEEYQHIAGLLAEKRSERERYIDDFMNTVKEELHKAGIEAEVTGRPKHIYSIWRKMQRKKLNFDQLFDIRAVRILVNEVADCYAALGIVHTQWRYIKSEFDDYVATPKENNYQSIHTAVIGPGGRTVEVQIRTFKMHQESELGVAAHWRYKEGKKQDSAFDEKIQWLRQLLEWKDEVADAAEFVDQFKSEAFEDRVYVFTPAGKVIDLPAGSTPIDFAYAIHSEVGHRCRGAKVGGKMVPLTYPLRTGEQAEIITVKQGGPSRDWLNPHLGYVATSRARSRIQSWFRQATLDDSIAAGRNMLDKELERLGGGDLAWEKLARELGHDKVNDLLAGLGRGEIRLTRLGNAIQRLLGNTQPPVEKAPELPGGEKTVRERRPAGISIEGVGNLVSQVAKCCKPIPGDPVKGYITRGQGVTIHREDCGNLQHYLEVAPERVIDVEWGAQQDQAWAVDIQVSAVDRAGLLRDITAVLADEKVNLTRVNTHSRKQDNSAHMTLTLELPDMKQLSRVMSKLGALPNVMDVRRVTG